MNEKYEHYSMVIQWSELDNVYIVTVPELPGCKTHGETLEEAVQQGKDAIESWKRGDGQYLPGVVCQCSVNG